MRLHVSTLAERATRLRWQRHEPEHICPEPPREVAFQPLMRIHYAVGSPAPAGHGRGACYASGVPAPPGRARHRSAHCDRPALRVLQVFAETRAGSPREIVHEGHARTAPRSAWPRLAVHAPPRAKAAAHQPRRATLPGRGSSDQTARSDQLLQRSFASPVHQTDTKARPTTFWTIPIDPEGDKPDGDTPPASFSPPEGPFGWVAVGVPITAPECNWLEAVLKVLDGEPAFDELPGRLRQLVHAMPDQPLGVLHCFFKREDRPDLRFRTWAPEPGNSLRRSISAGRSSAKADACTPSARPALWIRIACAIAASPAGVIIPAS